MTHRVSAVVLDHSFPDAKPTAVEFETEDWWNVADQAHVAYGAQFRGGHLPAPDRFEVLSMCIMRLDPR